MRRPSLPRSVAPQPPAAHNPASDQRRPAHSRSASGAEALFCGGACRLITALDLSHCGMDGGAAAHIASGLLCDGSPLEFLILEGNPLGPAGARNTPLTARAHGGSSLPSALSCRGSPTQSPLQVSQRSLLPWGTPLASGT